MGLPQDFGRIRQPADERAGAGESRAAARKAGSSRQQGGDLIGDAVQFLIRTARDVERAQIGIRLEQPRRSGFETSGLTSITSLRSGAPA